MYVCKGVGVWIYTRQFIKMMCTCVHTLAYCWPQKDRSNATGILAPIMAH